MTTSARLSCSAAWLLTTLRDLDKGDLDKGVLDKVDLDKVGCDSGISDFIKLD